MGPSKNLDFRPAPSLASGVSSSFSRDSLEMRVGSVGVAGRAFLASGTSRHITDPVWPYSCQTKKASSARSVRVASAAMTRNNLPEPLDCDVPGKRRFSIWRETFELDARYRPIKAIGKGAYGMVCSAEDTLTKRKVAIKKIINPFHRRTEAVRCLREVNILRQLRHPDVIQLYSIMKPADEDNFEDVYAVYECMDTDLHQIIRSKQSLTDDHHKFIIMQTLRGLMYLHSADIIHRDLKPSNLLLNANCNLKIADFGLARTKDSSEVMTGYVVTRWYRAPEILLFSPYTEKVDLWSVGCILAELLKGGPLFQGTDYLQTLRNVIQLLGKPSELDMAYYGESHMKRFIQSMPQTSRTLESKFANANHEALDLMTSLLQYNPSRRPTAAEALAHPWLNDIREPSSEILATSVFDCAFEGDALDAKAVRSLMKQEIQMWSDGPETA